MLSTTSSLTTEESSSAIAASLNSSLPLQLTDNDVTDSPGFVALLRQLSERITRNGVSVDTQKNMDDAELTLKQQRLSFLKTDILYRQLKDLLVDRCLLKDTIGSTDNSTIPGMVDSSGTRNNNNDYINEELYMKLDNALTVAEASQHLDFTQGGEASGDRREETLLFGLSPRRLRQSHVDGSNNSGGLELSGSTSYHHHQLDVEAIQHAVIPELEARLRSQCDALMRYYNSNSSVLTATPSPMKTLAERSSQLPELLDEDIRRIATLESDWVAECVNSHRRRWQCYETLMKGVTTLIQLLKEHRLNSQAAFDEASTNWLVARANALCEKMRLVKHQLLLDTYKPDTVDALAAIESHLNKRLEDLCLDKQRVSNSLDTFESVGKEFQDIVAEYTAIREEIETKKWAVFELRKDLDLAANVSVNESQVDCDVFSSSDPGVGDEA